MTLLLIAPFDLPKKLKSERFALRGALCHAFVVAKLAAISIAKITHHSCHGERKVARFDKASSVDVFSLDSPVLIPICRLHPLAASPARCVEVENWYPFGILEGTTG